MRLLRIILRAHPPLRTHAPHPTTHGYSCGFGRYPPPHTVQLLTRRPRCPGPFTRSQHLPLTRCHARYAVRLHLQHHPRVWTQDLIPRQTGPFIRCLFPHLVPVVDATPQFIHSVGPHTTAPPPPDTVLHTHAPTAPHPAWTHTHTTLPLNSLPHHATHYTHHHTPTPTLFPSKGYTFPGYSHHTGLTRGIVTYDLRFIKTLRTFYTYYR